MSLIPFANRRIVWCSSLQASQHSSIPHREIPLRFREPGLASWGHIAMFLSWSLTAFVYSPVRNSSSFSRTRLARPAREPNRPILILTSRLEINSVCKWPGNAMFLSPSPTTFVYSPFQNSKLGWASPPAFTRTTITSKSPSEAVFINNKSFQRAQGKMDMSYPH